MSRSEQKRLSLMAEAIREAYRKGQGDEQLEPLIRTDASGDPIGMVRDGDQVIFYDIRGEREIEITRAFTDKGFNKFPVKTMNVDFVTMTEYDPDLNVAVAFPPQGEISNTLAETVSRAGLKQVKVCESEKAIHVDYFLNGKNTGSFKGEKNVVIASPEIDDLSQQPEMSAPQVTAAACEQIRDPGNDLIVVNLANVDVLGHIENREAILKAVHTVDASIGKLVQAALEEDMVTLITADHGTVEKWYYPDGAIDTGHTDSRVPFIVAANQLDNNLGGLPDGKGLIDIAPTILAILGLEAPSRMTGNSLLDTALLKRLKDSGSYRRVLLIIADGWGYNPAEQGNLIQVADTPVMDRLLAKYPSTTLAAAGEVVGMPSGTVGNSEVGHMHIGSGRVIDSDRMRINRAIKDGSFFKNEAFLNAMQTAQRKGTNLHLYGIVSFYSSHGSLEYLEALIEMAAQVGVENLYVHSLLGRRGERPESGAYYIDRVEKKCQAEGPGILSTVIGRFWALDREENWDRVEKAYRAMVCGDGTPVVDPDL